MSSDQPLRSASQDSVDVNGGSSRCRNAQLIGNITMLGSVVAGVTVAHNYAPDPLSYVVGALSGAAVALAIYQGREKDPCNEFKPLAAALGGVGALALGANVSSTGFTMGAVAGPALAALVALS